MSVRFRLLSKTVFPLLLTAPLFILVSAQCFVLLFAFCDDNNSSFLNTLCGQTFSFSDSNYSSLLRSFYLLDCEVI
jgi:hypothetical protein